MRLNFHLLFTFIYVITFTTDQLKTKEINSGLRVKIDIKFK